MKNTVLISILVLFLLTTNGFSASDKIYSWIDEEGVQHFSDSPTYSVDKGEKDIETFLIDRHGRKQIIKTHKSGEVNHSTKPPVKQKVVQRTKPKLKSSRESLNLNVAELVKSSFLSVVFPFFLIVFLFVFLKFSIASYLKKLKSKKNGYQKIKEKIFYSNDGMNGPDTSSSEFKGFEGEQVVTDRLYQLLDRSKYHFFNDLTLPAQKGTTQIDHLIVSEYGIFIIETKNMKGSIYGNPYQNTWTQWLADGKHPFQNPFRQNYKHKKCLEALLKIESDAYFEVIVFMEHAKFPKGRPDYLFYPNELIPFIKSHTKSILSNDEVDMIISRIDASKHVPSFEIDKWHKAYVKSLLKEK